MNNRINVPPGYRGFLSKSVELWVKHYNSGIRPILNVPLGARNSIV